MTCILQDGKFLMYPMSGQIIPAVEHCCVQDELLGLHSWKACGHICFGESACSILYHLPNVDLEVEKAMHYHDEAYQSDNDYGLSA